MNNDTLSRFLNGDANDEEFKICETLLEDGQTMVDESAMDRSDLLVAALRGAGARPIDQDDSSRQLIGRIEGVVTAQVISQEELMRLLDPPQQADELGRIGRYRVLEFIAAGGMGLVFKAEDSHLNRLVCIKIMQPALALKPEARLRFERESRAAARLRSERIVTLLDIGVLRELPYIVMQLLDGESLRSKLSREVKLPTPLAVHYTLQIADGLRHAHAMGILHRDIKPDNIWITSTGDPKLLDFGLARPLDEAGNLTTTGGLIGTPQYMSPEQIQGQTLDARSDLFSLGVVLFEMLTGTLPFRKSNLFSTLVAITNDSVSLPAPETDSPIDCDVAVILHRMLKKEPHQRMQSAEELIDQLSQIGSLSTEQRASLISESTPTRAQPERGHAKRWRYVLAGVAAGLLAMLSLILVMQATNKGTLVVRSDDPQLEVRIAQEKIHVKDPLTGKSFEIQIGKMQLPSGVYQLELNDAASGLTFSSSTIAIRRGETVIVEAELQPAAQVVTKDAGKPSAEKAPDSSAASVNEPSVGISIADPSFQPAARDSFAQTLANLPAQSLAVPTSENQAKLEGIDSWSIDTNAFVDRGVLFNSDQTLFATGRGNTVQIWNTSLELKYTLQTLQSIAQVHFDNKYPNLIAVLSYNPVAGGETGEYQCELVVWRLGVDYAEIVHRLPTQGFQFAWDQGYRLFHGGREGLAAFRLDENKDYELHIPHDDMLENAISSSGRFLATRNGANIDVWDLHRGEFAFASLSSSQVQWNKQGDRAAFFARGRTAFEIWDLDKRAIDDRVELASEPAGREFSGTKEVAGLEPTFQRVAWLSPTGKLNVRNLRNNRQNSVSLPNLDKSPIKNASLQWEGGSLIIEADQASYLWTHDKSDVEGTLKERNPSALQVKKQESPLELTHVIGSSTPVLLWNDTRATELNRNKAANARDRQAELYFDAFDIAANRLMHETPFNQLRTSTYFSYSNSASNVLGPPYISHDGRYAISPNTTNARDVALLDFEDTDSVKKLELSGEAMQWGGLATVWDSSNRFALTTNAPNNFGAHKLQLVYDTQAKQFIDPLHATPPSGKIIEVGRSQHGFVMIAKLPATVANPTKPGPRTIPPKYSGELEVWRVDPQVPQKTKAEAATKLLAKLGTVESVNTTDSYLFISIFAEQENVESPTTVRKFYRIGLNEGAGSHVECVTVPQLDELYFSASGDHVIREARDAEVTGTTNDVFTGRQLQYRTKGPSKLYYARWSDVAKDLGDLEQFKKPAATDSDWLTLTKFKRILSTDLRDYYPSSRVQWHPTQDVAAWINNGYANFYSVKDDELRKTLAWSNEALFASDKGWTRADHNEVQFFEVSGKPIGKLMFDPYLENMQPAHPRWRLTDGSIAAQCSPAGLAISYQQGNRFYCQSVEEFERARPAMKLPRVKVVPY